MNTLYQNIHDWLAARNYNYSIETIQQFFALLGFILTTGLISIIYRSFEKISLLIKRIITRKDLHPYIDKREVLLATKYFIQTKGQNISPSNENELRYSQAFTTKQKLIPFYIDAIKNDNNQTKHYLILADSGMGKTTFLLNFYLSYKRIFIRRKYNIVILPLGHPEIENMINSIKNQEETILLLDGFDEDPKAVNNYTDRIEFYTKKTYKFRKIFITSRTQFFPSEDLEPLETKLYKPSLDNETQHYFKKMYISPFDDKDVKKYIKMKYPKWKFWTLQKRRTANQIIELCPNLMVRPMLLSYIDTLVDKKGREDLSKKVFLTSSDVYKILIERWILRESSRIDIQRRNDFINNMYKFSEELALYFFKNRMQTLTINSEEILPFAERNEIKLSELELKGKSLLNRDANGSYKFSHKSILEYFLAKKAIDDKDFGEGTLYFANMKDFDQAAKFCSEMTYN